MSLADVAAGADVFILTGVEVLAVLREVPLDCLVHQRAAAGTQIKGNDCHLLLGSSGDGLIWPDIIAGSCPDGGAAAL